ncbi:MAG: nucleotide exchange factor GrpE [Saprospiraceae bacterium]|nr:nucleotide exchange factor GrpE [Saprospiraceae bacterium]
MTEKDQLLVQEDAAAEIPETAQGEPTISTEDTQNQTVLEEQPDPLEELRAENAELKDKYIRLYAEFDTFRRRMMKEKLDLINTAAQDTMAALLPVLDDFDRAKKSADQADSTEQFSEGVTLVYQKLHNVLRQLGLEPMDTQEQPFDPEYHEAIAEIPAPTEELKGKIIDTIANGYQLRGKIIRHAKVVIGK